MSGHTLVVDAAVADVERPVVAALASQLGECLAHVSRDAWRVETRVHGDIGAFTPGDRTHVVVASLHTELACDDAIEAIAARWRERLAMLAPHASAILLCTIVRRAAGALPARADPAPSTIERIRRLDLLAVELSHDTGALVADLDRLFAHIGARTLGTDHRLGTPAAVEVAAWAILSTLVAGGTLDDLAGPGATELARGYLGGLHELPRFVQKRLQAR